MDNTFYTAPVPTPVPEPETLPTKSDFSQQNEDYNFTAEDIHEQLLAHDEDGYCPCVIVANIEKIRNVTEDTEFDKIPDEDRFLVDDLALEFCSADTYTLDGEIINLILEFDSPQDAYLRELYQFMKKYRVMSEHYQTDPDDNEIPMLTISFMPKKYKGHAILIFAFPISYFETLSENGEKTRINLLFHAENVEYRCIKLDKETEIELHAELQREMEEIEAAINGNSFFV